MTAKAVEDCYFYRDPRLVSLNEVGGDPLRFGVSAAGVPPRRRSARPTVAGRHDHPVHPRHQAR